LNYILALFLVIILSASAVAQTPYEQYMAQGKAGIASQDYLVAEKAFRAALQAKPDDPEATQYLAIVLSRTGTKEAESLLKQALLANPGDPKTNLQLGIYYFEKSVYPEAKDYFENTIAIAPGTDYARDAAEYLGKLGKKESKRFRLDAALGGQYDTNVILGPGNAPLPEGISRKSDWSAVGYLKAEYDIVSNENFRLTPGYSVYQSLHAKLSDFNVNYQNAGIEALYAVSDRVTVKGSYAFEYVFVGGNGYDSAHILSPVVMVNEGGGFFTTVLYTYRKTHFMNDEDLFPDNSDRSGSNNLIGISQYIPVGDVGGIKAGYTYDNDSARKDFWAYRGNKGFLNLDVKLMKGLSMDLYGEYYDQRYRGVNPAWSESARHDKVQTYSVSFTQRLTETFNVVAGQLYVRNKSNISDFDYKRGITSLFFTARF
jgi:tetratricopeptide (TPR) repeat protein